jgi:hypothetical protein
MNKIHLLTGVAAVSVFLATGAFAEILGVQPGTSDNPKDNVPKEILRGTPGGGTFGEGGTGPGTRSKALTETGMEQADIGIQQEIEHNAKQGGGAALAAEDLNEKSKNTSKKSMKSKHRKAGGASDTRNDGPKKDPKLFRQQNSDSRAQGQQLINEQPQVKQ